MPQARDLEKGDAIWLECANGRTRALILDVDPEAPDPRSIYPNPGPNSIGLHLRLEHAIWLPDSPRWRTRYWSTWEHPEEQFELCKKRRN